MSMFVVARRIDRLESRIDRIERELNLPLIVPAPGQAPPSDRSKEPVAAEPIEPAFVEPITEPTHPEPIQIEPALMSHSPAGVAEPPPILEYATEQFVNDEPPKQTKAAEAADEDSQPLPSSRPLASGRAEAAPVLPYAPSISAPPPQGALEQTIGLKWAGWIGALVLVIGAGLGIKYAYEQGYFDVLPPAGRLMLMSLGGFGLIAAGEWVFRRVNKLAAAAVYASGVATLFFVSHAGSAYYGLYEPTTAFVMMAMTTLVGAAVAMRGRLVSIAVLSLIGGNLAPFVLGREDLHVTPFLGYLLMLQVVSITLAWWGRDAFWRMLRGLSLASTALWMAPLLLRGDGSDWPVLFAFAVAYAVLYQVEVIASAIRRGMSDRAAGVSDDVGFSLAVTAALTTGLLLLFRDASTLWQGSCIAALAGACGFAGAVLSLLRRETIRPLSIGFLVQSAALAVLAVPVAFSGATVIIGWSILALMFAGAGAALDLRSLRAAAAGTWTLAVGQFVYQISTIGFEGESMSLMSAWLLAGVGHVVAWLMMVRETADAGAGDSRWSDIARLIAAAAGAVFAIASIAWLSPLGATAALLTYAWIAATADRFDARPGLILHAVAMVAIAAVKWVIVDTLADRLAPGWSAMAHRPLLNPLMGAGMLISLSLGGIYWLRRDAWPRLLGGSGSAARQGALAVAAALIILIGMALSIEIDRVVERAIAAGATMAMPSTQLKHLAWTMLWTTAALAHAAAARVIEPDADARAAAMRRTAGWVLLLAVKFVIVDTLFYRLGNLPAGVTPLANLQVLAAIVVLGGLAGARALLVQSSLLSRLTAVAGIFLVLWTGSLEIDRAFDGMAAQVALSIFWSLFAALCIGAGFRLRIAGLRYAGLALFAVALLKVVVVDLRGVADGYRVLSFMGLGALLLGTSVLYGKLSPKLLEE